MFHILSISIVTGTGPVQTIWPVVWVDEGADATEENLDLIKSMLVTHNMIHLT